MSGSREPAAPDPWIRTLGLAIMALGIIGVLLGAGMILDAGGPIALRSQAWLGAFFTLVGLFLLWLGRWARRQP